MKYLILSIALIACTQLSSEPTPVPTWTAIPEPTPTATNTPIPILAITPFPEPTVVPTPVLTPTPMVYPYPITTQDAIENLEFTLDSFSREVDYTWDCDHRKPKEDNTYILKSACEGTAKTEITVIYALLTVIYLHEGYVTIVLSLVEGEEDDTVVNYALCASTNPCMSEKFTMLEVASILLAQKGIWEEYK